MKASVLERLKSSISMRSLMVMNFSLYFGICSFLLGGFAPRRELFATMRI